MDNENIGVVDKDSESQFQFESPNVVLSHGGYSLQSSESILFCSQNVNLMSPDEARLLMAENRVHSDGSEFEEDTGSLELRRKQLLDNDAKKILEDPSDPDFYPDVEDEEDEEDDIEEPTGRINLEENYRRYIVDGQMLHQLFKKCQEPGCGFQNDEISTKLKGPTLITTMKCPSGHRHHFYGSSIVKCVKNKKKSKSTLSLDLHGSLATSPLGIREFFRTMKNANIWVGSKTSFYNSMNDKLHGIIQEEYKASIKEAKEEMIKISGGEKILDVTGDARHDSRDTALYGQYNILCPDTRKVISSQMVHKSETENFSSTDLERVGCRRALEEIHDVIHTIKNFGTDDSTSIAGEVIRYNKNIFKNKAERSRPKKKLSRREARRRKVNHQLCSWHKTRIYKKGITKIAVKDCKDLKKWRGSILRHIQYSFGACRDAPEKLQEMVMAIPKHIQGVHEFPENLHFKRCDHGDTGDTNKSYFEKGHPAIAKLERCLRGHNDIRYKKLLQHDQNITTSLNEVLHSVVNQFAPKGKFFQHRSMITKGNCSVLHWNWNASRAVKPDKIAPVCNKYHKEYRAKTVRESSSWDWQTHVISKYREAFISGRDVEEVKAFKHTRNPNINYEGIRLAREEHTRYSNVKDICRTEERLITVTPSDDDSADDFES